MSENIVQDPVQDPVEDRVNGADPRKVFDLDALEREGEVAQPFHLKHAGQVWELLDPYEMDWQELYIALGNPLQLLQQVVKPADRGAFFAHHMPTWKLNAFLKKYAKHYGLPGQGESDGSPG